MDTKGGVSHEMARATVQAHSFSERKKGSRRKHTCAAARVPYVFSGSAGKARAKASCRMPIKLNQASVRTSMHIDLPAPRGQDTRKDTRSTLHAFDQPGNDARRDERLRTARDEAPTYAARRRVSLPRPPALDQP
ncbi:P0490D09.7 [Oryza sativa (japonica cultivar-group)]|uniref:Uncharacterized protein n=4 Tax=Oryza TaxID=4527 RepID=Q8LJG1_ORYSJ|nr:hypothetical protein OsJ_03631 [Oryza sativa Japonica Group]BAC03255.1 hypothetical protein [Oryza sativa Japonica Group]